MERFHFTYWATRWVNIVCFQSRLTCPHDSLPQNFLLTWTPLEDTQVVSYMKTHHLGKIGTLTSYNGNETLALPTKSEQVLSPIGALKR